MSIIIGIGGTKGGCGKSNTTVNIASELLRLNFSVGILDADKKKSAENWAKSRNEFITYLEEGIIPDENEFIDFDVINESFTKNQLHKLREGDLSKCEHKHCLGDIRDIIIAMASRNDFVIVDVGGGDTKEFRQTGGMADILITPFKASTFDTDTIPELVDALDLALDSRPNLKIHSMVNEVPPKGNKNRGTKLIQVLKQYSTLENTLKTQIKSRTAYVDSLDCGLGVVDTFDTKAKGEISCLVHELLESAKKLGKLK